ncbi:hypothetical protein GQ457_17G006990 [Hibiscus cannabinus]
MEGDLRRATSRMSGMDEPIVLPVYGCGFPAQLKISWSNDNPGRRFFWLQKLWQFGVSEDEVQRRKERLLVLIELWDQYGIWGFVVVSDDCGLMVVV